MDAVEFLRAKHRFCEYQRKKNHSQNKGWCQDCPIFAAVEKHQCYTCDIFVDEKPVEAVQFVEKWAKEHPVKTRLSEFLKLCPNVSIQAGSCPSLCIKIFDSTVKCKDSESCLECRKKFWLTPIEEETNDSMDKIPEEW